MAYPGNHTLNTTDLTAYTPSCGGSPVAAYVRAPFRGFVKKFTGILGGAITTANGTVTLANATQGTTIGTFTVTEASSAAGQFQYGLPNNIAVAAVNQDDILVLTPSGASGSSIPMFFSVVLGTTQ
jgi:hypothetical protein